MDEKSSALLPERSKTSDLDCGMVWHELYQYAEAALEVCLSGDCCCDYINELAASTKKMVLMRQILIGFRRIFCESPFGVRASYMRQKFLVL